MFPKGSYKGQKEDGFLINALLKSNLDILVKNIIKDWDFTILITGGGEVRVGKSVLAMQIAYYLSYAVNKEYGFPIEFSLENNFVFKKEELIKKGHYLGKNFPYSSLIFDEAGADLEGRKTMTASTKQVLDYFREAGQYNLFNILVIPELFDLPKGIALSRSIFLIDIYYSSDSEGNFRRGYFNFYSRPSKKKLYLYGKKDLNYHAAPRDFNGRFSNFYPIDEEEYRKLKEKALLERAEKKMDKTTMHRNTGLMILRKEYSLTIPEIIRLFAIYNCELSKDTILKATNENP